MELEKLICYCLDRDVVTAEDVEAVCTTRITNHIFDMVNAIAEKQPQKALQLYYDLLALKEPPMRVLFLIARQCNLLLQTKELKTEVTTIRPLPPRSACRPLLPENMWHRHPISRLPC